MLVSDVRCLCQSVMKTDENLKNVQARSWPGGSGGLDPSEILKVTFMNRVNPCTFLGEWEWGYDHCPLARTLGIA